MIPGLGKSGISLIYCARFMISPAPGLRASLQQVAVKGYGFWEGEATMPFTIRRATLADTRTIVEFNQRLAEESEGKTLDQDALARGVAATFADPHKGPYFLAVEGGKILGQLQITFEW